MIIKYNKPKDISIDEEIIELRIGFEKWLETLNKFDINGLQREYIKTNGVNNFDYKTFDIWLFNEWSIKNE